MATVDAASASYADVAAAVTSAGVGGTVNVPAGEETWGSRLNLTAGVNLIGAGIGNTIIHRGNSGGILRYVPSNWDLNTPFRVSGFSFDAVGTGFSGGDANPGAICNLGGPWYTPVPPYTPQTSIRFDHNRCYSSSGNCQYFQHCGAFYGCMDNNIIEDSSYPTRPGNWSSSDAWWAQDALGTPGFAWVFGDQYKLNWEDNVFTDLTTQLTNAQWSARYAYRYNTITTGASWMQLFDIHGVQSSSMCSAMGAEIYGNEVTNSDGGRFCQWRGGSGVTFYNNVRGKNFTGACSSSEVICPTTYADGQMIHDLYFWNNRNGVAGALQEVSTDSTLTCTGRTRPVRGTDFFDNGSSPAVSMGPLASRPASPSSVGQAYWATAQSTTNLTGMVGANPATPISGTLYYSTDGATWDKSFTPYTYPHPLRDTSSPPVGTPVLSVR